MRSLGRHAICCEYRVYKVQASNSLHTYRLCDVCGSVRCTAWRLRCLCSYFINTSVSVACLGADRRCSKCQRGSSAAYIKAADTLTQTGTQEAAVQSPRVLVSKSTSSGIPAISLISSGMTFTPSLSNIY